MSVQENGDVFNAVKKYSSQFDYKADEVAVILAAGHGKRIKSQRSKMLHKIWDEPTVVRVLDACCDGLKNANAIVVVGIKATDVIEAIGTREKTLFAYQKNQNGTGHAVQVALENIDDKKFDGNIYVLPGDMGLIDKNTMKNFRDDFLGTNCDMMVLTGLYDGNPKNNYYGRIIRVKEKDANGNPSGDDEGKVIEIMEFKDIMKLNEKEQYSVKYNGKIYSYSKKELIENNEFNSGVYAFKYKALNNLIRKIKNDNVQNEIYLTDLISIYNKEGLSVKAVSPLEPYAVMGFNNKSVLAEMENVARMQVYEKLKDIIEIQDPEDFFIHETVVEEILETDKKNIPLDITIGKGVHIGKGVKLNYNIEFKKNAFAEGNVHLGKNVTVWQNVHLSTYPNQVLKIGDYVEIYWGNIIKGNTEIGEGCKIESSVNMTGSDEFPLRIGKNVLIKGTSYIFGSIIDDDLQIEHSVIVKKHVEKLVKKDGTIQPIRFYLPMPSGIDAIEDLDNK